MEANKQEDQLIFNMDGDSNITQINNTETTEPVKKGRGRPKRADTEPKAKEKATPQPQEVKPSNKAIVNLENKLTKFKNAERQYNDALQNLNNQVKPTPKPKSKAKPRTTKIEDIITDN